VVRSRGHGNEPYGLVKGAEPKEISDASLPHVVRMKYLAGKLHQFEVSSTHIQAANTNSVFPPPVIYPV
jgi:hypothetical protein